MRSVLLTGLSLWLSLGCNGSGDKDASQHDDGHSRAKPADRMGEVQLSPEALERAGIQLGVVQRRALSGGVAIPAEVEFEPSSTAHVGPLVPGRITRVAVALGDRVRRGQVLGTVASSDVSSARARLDQARARLLAAESTLKRQQQLSSEGIAAQRSLIDAEAQVGELRAEVEGLGRQLAVFGSGSAGELVLSSPLDGVVVSVHATLGETVTPEQSAFVITDPTKVWVRGNVPELELSQIEVGYTVIVRLHAFPELNMRGSITYASPAVDERTRSLPIRVVLEAPDYRLRSGLFGSIELVGGKADARVLVVPVEAVATLDGQTVVFVSLSEDGRFRATPVLLGRRAGAWIEVRSGVSEGNRLALGGAFILKSALEIEQFSDEQGH